MEPMVTRRSNDKTLSIFDFFHSAKDEHNNRGGYDSMDGIVLYLFILVYYSTVLLLNRI
jgi:hypothetical protein